MWQRYGEYRSDLKSSAGAFGSDVDGEDEYEVISDTNSKLHFREGNAS